MADGKSTHTLSCYRRDFGLLLGFAGDVEAVALTADLLARFLLSAPSPPRTQARPVATRAWGA